jgi:hypothetical protein
MLEMVERLNTGIRSVSDGERYVTLLISEIDARQRRLRYVNCGHNPALLFRAKTGTLTRMNSSCPPIGIFPQETCELASTELITGDVLVFYTDGVTEAENRLGEEFGTERLSAVVRLGSSLSAEGLMTDIFRSAANFCSEVGFNDDVTILVDFVIHFTEERLKSRVPGVAQTRRVPSRFAYPSGYVDLHPETPCQHADNPPMRWTLRSSILQHMISVPLLKCPVFSHFLKPSVTPHGGMRAASFRV